MSDSPPPSLLITPDTRRRLQQRYEEAVRLTAQRPCDFARVHELLAECLRADPGNILYLDALLANLRRWGPKPRRSWLPGWLHGAKYQTDSAADRQVPEALLRDAPNLLFAEPANPELLGQLADAASACAFDEVELRYLLEARERAPDDPQTLRQLARAQTRQGRFDEAVGPWLAVLALAPDAEAQQAVEDLKRATMGADIPAAGTDTKQLVDVAAALESARRLRAEGQFSEADLCLQRALFAGGGDLRVFEEREALRLAQSAERLAISRARAAADPHPRAQALVERMEQEHNRLEIDIFHLRSERHPGDASLRLELARRLKKAGNYSGAIQRLEEARADERQAADVLLELGECWQHLRQFGKALDIYRQAVELSEVALERSLPPLTTPHATQLAALYRIGVLAAAMDQPAEAKSALTRLVAINPEHKDARQRLDNLP